MTAGPTGSLYRITEVDSSTRPARPWTSCSKSGNTLHSSFDLNSGDRQAYQTTLSDILSDSHLRMVAISRAVLSRSTWTGGLIGGQTSSRLCVWARTR